MRPLDDRETTKRVYRERVWASVGLVVLGTSVGGFAVASLIALVHKQCPDTQAQCSPGGGYGGALSFLVAVPVASL